MEPINDLTAGQRAFLVSYFPSIFDEDEKFTETDLDTFIDELSTTEFSWKLDVEMIDYATLA